MTPMPRIIRRQLDGSHDEDGAGWPAHLHPVLRRIYQLRGIRHFSEVEHRLGALAAPSQLSGLQQACAVLHHALEEQQHIIVVGDFDADGATGTAVAVRGLRMLGARHVDYRVPNRIDHGYGLSTALVEEIAAAQPDLIITVDNGISSVAGVATAQQLGMRVIITDHHLPGPQLPAADAVVNPNLPGDDFPSKALAGVGVMFYVLLALRAQLRDADWFAHKNLPEPDLRELLDLVALGTVADLVPLDYNNRILVHAGLQRMRAGRACAGIAALFEVSGRSAARIDTSDLAFAIAPRINAAGRIADMGIGIDCLLSDDPGQAQLLARRLSEINAQRRDVQTEMVAQAEEFVSDFLQRHGSDALPVGLVLHEPDWHPGVVGLLASKLKDQLHRPVIVCAPGGEDGMVSASARSIAGFHIRDALVDLDAAHPGLITRFGGHAMAAGLSLPADNVTAFAEAFDALCRSRITSDQLQALLHTDGELADGDLDMALARQLRMAGPWGQAFPAPLFDNAFEVESWRPVGASGTHLAMKLRLPGSHVVTEAIHFGGYTDAPPPSLLRAVYELVVDEWNGREKVKLMVRHHEPE